jgi:ABC-type amino acid transport system permease subunit
LTTGGRWAWAYILRNIGVLLASVVVYVDFAIEYLAGWHVATVELYLASVLLALVIGVVVGVRVRPAP